MSNRQLSPVSYRRFQPQPLLSEGLLAVERQGGDLERKVAMGLARLADEMGRRADAEAERAGKLAGARDALAGAPTGARVTGGGAVTTTSGGGQSGPVRPAQGGGVRVRVPPAEIRKIIVDAAIRNGEDPDTLVEIAGIESSFNPFAKNPNSSAGGLFQFIDSTAAQFGLRDKFDAAASSDAAARLQKTNRNYLRNKLGREPTPGELYLAHQQGAGGAVKLLSNPDARAVDVVGADAVRLNAGDASMTAAQFASRWTSKVGGYAKLPAPASVGPVSVTMVEEPVEVTPGQAGTWRPSGRNTIRGRAYDVAGTRTYLEMADLAMVENQQAIYEEYKDDPVKLEQALGEGLEAELRDNVLDEIAPEFTVAYRKRASSLLSKARAEHQERLQQQNRVDFLGRVEELENSKSQRIAGLDPNDEAAASDLANLQASIEAHWDSAVARGIVDLDDAEKFKRSSRSDTTVGFYVRQASKMGADDIKAMRAQMTKDYAAGSLEGVTADDWAKIDQGLSAAESARRTQDAKADADLTKRGEDLAKRIARGLPVTPEELARFQLDAGTAPKGKVIVASTLTRMRVSEAIRTMPIAQVEKNIKQLLGEDATAEDIDFARTTIAQHRKDIATDPLGVAERFGVLPVSEGLPLDGEIDPASASAAFSERINAAKVAAEHLGTAPKFFRPGEAEQIEAAVKADPQRGLDIAAGLVDAAGRDADRVLRELGDVAPAVSLSGSLIAAGGNRQAAADLISGYGKTPDGKDYADIPNTKRLPAAREISGDALAYTPGEINRLDQAAASIARKRLHDTGIDPKKEDAAEIYERAYQEAAGATFANGAQYGGFADYDRGWRYSPQKVLLPPTVRADKFPDLMEALTDADLGGITAKNGKPWTARDFQRAMPVAVNGGFVFALGDVSGSSPMFIADEKGDPIVLDLETLRPALEPRVPGAYR
ncbi:transglycosylase SLT domain-containing protein [Rhizobium halophilum]|uniref:transglycosylase SLT domain-containing protein n=1 Tax=Rhizobium halophilum TaxID=2846852 RepID=UPI001EFD285D|nr:transglycosylase SLT domain-containing protein [Rhizobium halophilum]MCF6368343.1 transglycosylase SLT domain-containing protein [Rhizobium halophilum]